MKQESKEIVVIGAGAAGLAAAIAAREKGAEVTILEKGKRVGGISVTGMGIFAVESHLQKAKNVDFSRDEAFEKIMDMTQWKADARLVRAYVDKSGDTVKWLEDMGIEFTLLDKLTYPGAINQTGHLVVKPGHGIGANATSHMIGQMEKQALQLGAEIRLGVSVKDISHEDSGYCVRYADADEQETEIRAKAVVIAAGGYVHDKEMMANTGAGYELGKNFGLLNSIPLTGEGIRMAWKLGGSAGRHELNVHYIL